MSSKRVKPLKLDEEEGEKGGGQMVSAGNSAIGTHAIQLNQLAAVGTIRSRLVNKTSKHLPVEGQEDPRHLEHLGGRPADARFGDGSRPGNPATKARGPRPRGYRGRSHVNEHHLRPLVASMRRR
jgi:hypothetical protein